MSNILERFLNYVKIDTRSDDSVTQIPSTEGQWTLAKLLEKELLEMGLEEVLLTDRCFVHGVLKSNVETKLPVIGLMAHLDTYPGFTAAGVNPLLHQCYDGGKLMLNIERQTILSPDEFPDLLKYIGEDIITTDGTTLLGADDKAGIAEIMEAVAYFISHPEIPHGELRIVFTPDEETDRGGLEALDRALLPVDFVITMDGDGVGEVNFENFNAAHANINITGRSVHTGEAKGRMINACAIANEWISRLPKEEVPEHTENYEGFYHIEEMSGNVEHAHIYCLIRDFYEDAFMQRKDYLKKLTAELAAKYGENVIQITLTDDYRNMKHVIERDPVLIEAVIKSIRDSGITPKIMPIRGGTDGALLAEMGILAPNIFLGGHNYHGQYEFISVQAMEKATNVLVNLISNYAVGEKVFKTDEAGAVS